MQDTPKYHYMIREGSTMQSRYNPQKEYNLFQSVYEQVKFILEKVYGIKLEFMSCVVEYAYWIIQ